VAGSINSVVLVGNLTRDPELRATPSGTSVCSLRVAVNDRVKDPTTGEWGDKPNYFDVDVFGGQGERCAQYLARGRQVAIAGRLRWREWETQDGQKRQAVSIVADNVQFIGPREGGGGGYGQQQGGYQQPAGQRQAQGQGSEFTGPAVAPAHTDFGEPGDPGGPDDDIPF
jgi:single-strand DNA-binding protein